MADHPSDSTKQTQLSPRTIRILIVALVVVGCLAKEKSRNIVETYRGTTTIQVLQRMDGSFFGPNGQPSVPDYYQRKLNTIAATLANMDLMKQVIKDHDLLNNETFAGRDASSEDLGMLARRLVNRTTATLREDTELIDVSFRSVDRELARNLVNWIALGFVKQHSNQRLNMNRKANELLTNEAERLKVLLRNAEVALIDFRRTSKLVVSLEERQSIVASRVASLNQSKDSLDLEVARLEADLALVKTFGDEPSASQFEHVPSI